MVMNARIGARRSHILIPGEVWVTTTIVGIQMGSPDLGATKLQDLQDGATVRSGNVIIVTKVFKQEQEMSHRGAGKLDYFLTNKSSF